MQQASPLDSFNRFVETVVLPAKAANPHDRRLDGERAGGNWNVVGGFEYQGREWEVHADTHYESLLIAYEAAQAGIDPFMVRRTKTRTSLDLHPDQRLKLSTRFKYLYIYER